MLPQEKDVISGRGNKMIFSAGSCPLINFVAFHNRMLSTGTNGQLVPPQPGLGRPSESPELRVDTTAMTPEEAAQQVVDEEPRIGDPRR